MQTELRSRSHSSTDEATKWVALGAGAVLLLGAARARALTRLCLAAGSAPLLYRGVTGHWPAWLSPPLPSSDTRIALGGERGIHVRESVVVDRPAAEVFRFWRHLENLPQFMRHLTAVTQTGDRRSRWVAAGPGGLPVEWNAEINHEVPDKRIGWRSLDGSDVVSAGSVNFDSNPGGSTTVTVHLQYAPPAGRAGAFVASLLGAAPSAMIREDLWRLKTLLEQSSSLDRELDDSFPASDPPGHSSPLGAQAASSPPADELHKPPL